MAADGDAQGLLLALPFTSQVGGGGGLGTPIGLLLSITSVPGHVECQTVFQPDLFQSTSFVFQICPDDITPAASPPTVAPTIEAVPTSRGFDETLEAFRLERRRIIEEMELVNLMDIERDLIIKAIKPFLRH